jgi:hemerythrin-like domain-containing protein
MKPTEDLMHEHKAIKVMLSIMSKIAENIRNQANPDPDEIDKIVDFLKTFADKCHHGKEETVLFPALIEAGMPKENGPVAVMLHDHDLGRALIKSIASYSDAIRLGDKSAFPLVAGAMEEYKALMENHINKENNILFPMADKVLPEEKQNEIYSAFERIEEEVVGHGVHERYHDFLNQLKTKYLV